MKLNQAVAIIGIVLCIPLSARAEDSLDFTKVLGTYSTRDIDFVTLKRMTFSKEKDGTIKVAASLVGFPDEVSIGEAVPELYRQRKVGDNPTFLTKFSSQKYKPFVVIRPTTETGTKDGPRYRYMVFTCYMTDLDGKQVHISGSLERDSLMAQ